MRRSPSSRLQRVRSAGLLTISAVLAFSYTIEPGDTLSQLAQRLGVAATTLAEENGLDDPDRLIAGAQLRVPGQADDGDRAEARHRVQGGETLSGIARRFGVATSTLAGANGLDDPDRLIAGTRLTIPGVDPGPGAAPPPARTEDVAELLERTAAEHGWSPAAVKAVAWQESGWRQDRVSSAGAIGIMQVMPGTGQFVSTHLAGRPLDLDDPADNVLAGVLFLDYLYDLTDGDPQKTLAGYYQGLASVRENGTYLDTRRYVANVLALRERFR